MFIFKNFDLIWIFSSIERKNFTNKQRCFGLLAILFRKVVKTDFYFSYGTVWGKVLSSEKKYNFLTFSDTDWKKFGHLRKISRLVCQNCFLCVQRNTSGIDVLFEKLCFHLHLLGHWVKNFHYYGKKILAFWPYCVGRIVKFDFYLS